jgi:hypothetical protein
MVKPQYTDQHRKQADKRTSERIQRAQEKRPQGVADPDGPIRKRVHSRPEDTTAGHSTRKKSRSRVDQAQAHTPQTADNLIVREERHQSYEVAAMDTYINTRQRGICRRRMSNVRVHLP